jgi:major capsid protein
MSLSVPRLDCVKVLDPRLIINNHRRYIVLKGAKNSTFQQFMASSGTATNAIQFKADPPNPQTVVSRKVYMKWFVNLAFTGVPALGTTLLQLGTNDGFRAFPISEVLTTMTAEINNNQVSTSLNQYIKAFLHYNNGVCQQDYDFSITPDMLDTYQEYNDWTIYGSARNPLAKFGENSAQQNRGGFPYVSVTNPIGDGVTTMTSIVMAQLTEPLFMAPFLFGHGEHSGFVGVQTMQFNFQTGYGLLGLPYMWSHSAGGNPAFANPVVTFYATPQLLFEYLSPDPLEAIPSTISYPYFTYQTYPSVPFILAPGAIQSVILPNVQLSNIPNRICLFATQDANTVTNCSVTDTFCAINQVQIQFNNQAALMSTATSQDLYQKALRNGYSGNWADWSQYQGAVLMIDPSLDLSLGSDECDGVIGSRNLMTQVTLQNLSTISKQFVLWQIIITEGVFTIENQQVITLTSVLNAEDVLSAKQMEGKNYAVAQSVSKLSGGCYNGGNFFDDFMGGFKTVMNPALDLASMVPGYGIGAKLLKAGLDRAPGKSLGYLGSGHHRHHRKHGHRRGGQMLSRAELAQGL